MRHVTRAILAVAISVLIATEALADVGDILFDNQYATNASSNDPYATTAGLIWIDTGNGVPFKVPNPQDMNNTTWDLNIELLGGTMPGNLARLVRA